MLKNKKILIMFVFVLALIVLGSLSTCYATEDGLKIVSFEITAPQSGIYGVGTEVTLTIKFSKPIKGTLPKFAIYFGNYSNNEIELDGPELTTYSDTATYKYTIKSGDNGELKQNGFIDTSNYQIETEDGTRYWLTSPFGNFQNKIYADTTITRADLSNATFEWIAEQKNHNGLKLKMNGATTIEGNNYYVHLSHNKDENITVSCYDSIYDNLDIWSTYMGLENMINREADNIVATQGDIYIWICELDSTYNIPKILVSGQKIERLEQLPLGSRLKAYFFDDYTSTFCWETSGEEDRKINVKIGTISDISILKSIKNGESGCLDKLLTYAKTAQSIYTGTVPVGESKEIVSSMNLVDDGYYYVYMELEDEDGKYYPVEDVSLYQALVGDTVTMLCDYLDDNFKWNLEEENNTPTQQEPTIEEPSTEEEPSTSKDEIDDTVAKDPIPQTGSLLYIVIITIILLGLVGIITYKKIRYLNFK